MWKTKMKEQGNRFDGVKKRQTGGLKAKIPKNLCEELENKGEEMVHQSKTKKKTWDKSSEDKHQ